MSKIFFCYEFVHGDRPSPVIYYGEVPKKNVKEQNIHREKIIDISHHSKGADNEISLSEMSRIYPYLTKEIITPIIKQQEIKKVSQAVSGYLTRNNQFFPTKAQADFYDVSFDLHESATEAVRQLGVTENAQITTLVEAFKTFLIEEIDLISEFVSAKRALSAEAERANAVAGSTAGNHTTIDLPIQSGPDTNLVEEAPAEVLVEGTGKKSKSTKPISGS